MGKLEKGILGGFIGKVGTVIGGRYRGLDYMKSKGPSTRKNNAPAQLEQKAKFALAFKFARRMRKLFSITFDNKAAVMTANNYGLGRVIAESVTGVYPNFTIDYSKVPISRGSLELEPQPPVLSVAAGILKWQWVSNQNKNGADPKDRTILVAFCPTFDHVAYDVHGPARETNAATLDVTAFMGATVNTWIAFISEDGKRISDSVYTGQILVA